jgi:hypothetical protein
VVASATSTVRPGEHTIGLIFNFNISNFNILKSEIRTWKTQQMTREQGLSGHQKINDITQWDAPIACGIRY